MSVPTDPCDIALCGHPRQHCEVVDGLATCVCNELCPLILMPVCGSDGQSYPNDCNLEVEACVTGKELTVVSKGECGNLLCIHDLFYHVLKFTVCVCGHSSH